MRAPATPMAGVTADHGSLDSSLPADVLQLMVGRMREEAAVRGLRRNGRGCDWLATHTTAHAHVRVIAKVASRGMKLERGSKYSGEERCHARSPADLGTGKRTRR